MEVARRLLAQIESSFDPQTWEAFQLLTREELSAQQVAEQLDMPIASVYQAKSRVLAKLRESAGGLIDD